MQCHAIFAELYFTDRSGRNDVSAGSVENGVNGSLWSKMTRYDSIRATILKRRDRREGVKCDAARYVTAWTVTAFWV